MRNLNNLLEKFYQSLTGDEARRQVIASTINEVTRGNINPNQVFYKEGVLEIECSAVFKNEISLKERQILEKLKEHSVKVSRILYK